MTLYLKEHQNYKMSKLEVTENSIGNLQSIALGIQTVMGVAVL